MASSTRPGDLLAGRYRLIDLLAESGGGRFWRAHDPVLERHVALHVISADDPRAEGLIDAAQRSATILDHRILRVLDAETVDGLCHVVNEWGTGTSLDIMLACGVPLGPRRSSWLVAEVADAVATAHAARVAHGRLNPENVLVDRGGNVKLIGLAVDAALHGLPSDDPATCMDVDVLDLAGLLYSSLTGRWAGASTSEVPAAPVEHGDVLRPRQVRAGIPRPLDALCEDMLRTSRGRGHALGLVTSRAVCDYLRDFVGDPDGVQAALAASLPTLQQERMVVLPPVPDFALRDADGEPSAATDPASPNQPPTQPPIDVTLTSLSAKSAKSPENDSPATEKVSPRIPPPSVPSPAAYEPDLDDDAAPSSPIPSSPIPSSPAGPTEARRPPREELATEAGLPIFGDQEVTWLETNATPPPPPPPFEDPPERPLFAPEPAGDRPQRQARAGVVNRLARPEDYWPWGADARGSGPGNHEAPAHHDAIDGAATDDDEVPGRTWIRLAVGVAASALLLLAVVVAFNLGRGKTPLGAEPEPGTPDRQTTVQPRSVAVAPFSGLIARDFDPEGGGGGENPDQVGLAVDGDQATAWQTSGYRQQLGPGGLKSGVGLSVDLGDVRTVSEVSLLLDGNPTGVSLYLSPTPLADLAGLTPVSREVADAASLDLRLQAPQRGRFLVVWLTSLPQDGVEYRGRITEVVVKGV